MRKRIIFIVLCVLVCFVSGRAGALPAQNITPEQWQRLTSDKAFSYKNDKESVQQASTRQVGAMQRLFRSIFDFFGQGGGNLLLWLVILFALLFVSYHLTNRRDRFLFQRGKKSRKAVEQGPVGDDIATADWDALLQQAVAANDLRLAVRYSYMRLLQLLQQRALIKYRNDKTNYEYYSELTDAYRQPFRQLSRQYEYAWYGGFTLSATAYGDYMRQFNDLKKQLGA